MSRSGKRAKSLAFRLSLGILSASAILVAGILYYNYHFSKRLLLESARETAEQLTRATMNRMESILVSAQRVPEGLNLFLQHPGMNENELNEMLKFVLQNKPEIYGSAVAFAPYALRPDQKELAPYCYRSDDGFVFKDLAADDYDYFFHEWYVRPRDSGQAVWVEPYFDIGGGNVLMTTYSMPIYKEKETGKEFMGVATADLSLGWLEEMLNSIKVFETGYAYLVSEKGTLITHPVRELQMKNIHELAKANGDESLVRIASAMMQNEEGYLPFISMIDQRPCWVYFSTLPQTKWHLAVVFPEEELFAGLKNLYFYTVFMGIAGIILLSLVVILFSARFTKPLRRLTLMAGEIGAGNFNVMIEEDRSTREIALLGSAFNRMQSELKDYMENLKSTTAAKERFESELNIAHDIQQGMIPKIFPPFPDREDIDIYALLEPARQVGGDFYDFFFLDDETLCFGIGDVSDKGVPASLMMAMMITLFRAKMDLQRDLHALVGNINQDISKDNVNLMFITFFAGMINLRTGKMKYCNAGHNYPLIMKRNGTLEVMSETHGIPLGIDVDFNYKSGEISLAPGETLILYTDGITEALSITGEFYGEERLAEIIRYKCTGLDPGNTCRAIMEDVGSFTNNPERSDDITLMVMAYFPDKK
jgi:sigma-B regulation protein RsbU (phosphoserine phosphatase)